MPGKTRSFTLYLILGVPKFFEGARERALLHTVFLARKRGYLSGWAADEDLDLLGEGGRRDVLLDEFLVDVAGRS